MRRFIKVWDVKKNRVEAEYGKQCKERDLWWHMRETVWRDGLRSGEKLSSPFSSFQWKVLCYLLMILPRWVLCSSLSPPFFLFSASLFFDCLYSYPLVLPISLFLLSLSASFFLSSILPNHYSSIIDLKATWLSKADPSGCTSPSLFQAPHLPSTPPLFQIFGYVMGQRSTCRRTEGQNLWRGYQDLSTSNTGPVSGPKVLEHGQSILHSLPPAASIKATTVHPLGNQLGALWTTQKAQWFSQGREVVSAC